MKLQTVYIPTSDDNNLLVGSIDKQDYYKSFTKERNVKEVEVFVFTPEELKKLLEDYTDRIVTNADVTESDEHFQDVCFVNDNSITSQLPKFLKELGL